MIVLSSLQPFRLRLIPEARNLPSTDISSLTSTSESLVQATEAYSMNGSSSNERIVARAITEWSIAPITPLALNPTADH